MYIQYSQCKFTALTHIYNMLFLNVHKIHSTQQHLVSSSNEVITCYMYRGILPGIVNKKMLLCAVDFKFDIKPLLLLKVSEEQLLHFVEMIRYTAIPRKLKQNKWYNITRTIP